MSVREAGSATSASPWAVNTTGAKGARILGSATPDSDSSAAFAETAQLTLVTFDRGFKGKAKPLILLAESD